MEKKKKMTKKEMYNKLIQVKCYLTSRRKQDIKDNQDIIEEVLKAIGKPRKEKWRV